jgi:hypothetical protein
VVLVAPRSASSLTRSAAFERPPVHAAVHPMHHAALRLPSRRCDGGVSSFTFT